MVDFSKKLKERKVIRKIDPIEIYDSLDRKSETGPLRPSQEYILNEWFSKYRDKKDLIIKLHTGEGKTLIGLLILHSRLNSNEGPCLYICPNIYLVEQTCLEADKFGVPYCRIGEDNQLPEDFLSGKKILITHVHKVFNGLTIFGLDAKAIPIKHIVLDDSHACIDSLKDTFTIKISSDHKLYSDFLALFEDDLITQGEGSYLEIKAGDFNTLLPIPYWAWIDKKSEVISKLIQYKNENEIKFVWPLIKDNIENCQAYVSGKYVEISPVYSPIYKFTFFTNADQRILMSATTQDDSFFIKGLGFSPETVSQPLTYEKLKWSGEKLILIPSLINEELDRNFIVTKFAKPNPRKKFGIVAIVPSFKKAAHYQNLGATITTSSSIYEILQKLKSGELENTIVVVNRYDGIDLPDESCRILILDSKPFFDSLSDRYEESCRPTSDIVNIKIAQKIEQGIGRSVRGEKDYSIIVITGGDLTKFLMSPLTKRYFSHQTQKQIEIALEVAELAKNDFKEDESPFEVVRSLINQVLRRDEGWKQFYQERMNEISTNGSKPEINHILYLEKKAQDVLIKGDLEESIELIQQIVDELDDEEEKGWYLQLMARYKYKISKVESNKIQKSAYQKNLQLMIPKEGIVYKKLEFINENRLKRIKDWIKKFDSYSDMMVEIDGMLEDLSFGMPSEKFESALKSVGEALGFLSQRPDKEFKKGPDNLWCGVDNKYFIFECKSEVDDSRKTISKSEAGQMNNHCGWFESEYGSVPVKRILIIPIRILSKEANFTHEVFIMRKGMLRKLKKNIKNFFKEFKNYNINEISDEKLQQFLNSHELDMNSLWTNYIENYYKET
ncbi:MAG TPA: DEAD/DEAH box helicase [Candidatus Desulfofervidus auxilii]|uniref:DEAD/DEAH box helicase n=1 Tax=Desulfofervidus auxilii TaxID=1621989 RepID=A0A7C1VKX1_DESA2|nr:DEAD/DEAH box helicase [Candidatus Desulfofervidus auxilii]